MYHVERRTSLVEYLIPPPALLVIGLIADSLVSRIQLAFLKSSSCRLELIRLYSPPGHYMGMGGNGDVSPAVGRSRVSRLKKRRSGDAARSSSSCSREANRSSLCSLQKLNADDSIPHPAASKGHDHRHDGAPTVAELPSLPPSNDALDPLSSSQGEILSFVDSLDHPISNIVEVNEDLFNDASLLSSAFSTRDANEVEVPQHLSICNSLMGKIPVLCEDAASNNETVAFPSTARHEAGREADKWGWMGGVGATRKSGDGTVIPLSMIQFPGEASSEGVLGCKSERIAEGRASPSEQSRTRCVSDNNPVQEFAAKTGNSSERPAALKAAVSPAEIRKRAHNSSSLRNCEMQRNAGRIRIISDRGATIREVFDIDESNFIVGKLQVDDERAFVEKRSLSPPPIDDSESDEGCVNVMRYRVVLERDDYNDADSDSLERDAYGRPVAWISDRGRLADDAYLILNEMP